MHTLQKIGKFEAISIIIIITINQIILNLPNTIIMSTGSSAWINVIYISIIAIAFCLLICKLFKPFPTNDIIDISEYLGGKILKTIIGILFIVFFIFIAGILVRYLSNSLKLIYFERAPLVFLLLLFFAPIAVGVKLGIKSISQVNLIFMPIILFSVLIIIFSTVKDFIPQRIYPIMGFGINKTFLTGLNNIFAFSGFAYIYFLAPILKHPKEFKKIALVSIIISAIYIFLSVVCLLMIFPFIPFSEEMLSVYLLTRMIEFGRFFQRIDAIFIFIWILSTLSFLTITSGLVTLLFKKITHIKNHKEMIYSVLSLIFSIALIIKNIANIKLVQNTVFKFIIIIFIFIISPLILIFANLKLKRRKSIEN
ncbi:MAG: GerAB/ArcD/ProY family transporter [Clostridia bacterium]|nr:GerAB/ArcD/ProY family transporter [Clostridia bacterium]